MKILSNREYQELLGFKTAHASMEEMARARHNNAVAEHERGLAEGRADNRRTEREEFITKLRAAFLNNPGATLADLLKEYDCRVAPYDPWPNSLAAQLGAQQSYPRQGLF